MAGGHSFAFVCIRLKLDRLREELSLAGEALDSMQEAHDEKLEALRASHVKGLVT